MKKSAGIALALTMTAAMLAGCGSTAATTAAATTVAATTVAESTTVATETTVAESTTVAETAAAGERTTFTVGFDANFPPYGYKADDGTYVGFDLDLAQEVATRNGWELVKQPIDWDSKDMELSSGSIDCIWNGFTMNGREDAYDFTTPYVDNSQVFVVASESGITTPDALAGKVVLVQADSSALAALNEEENAALKNSFAEMTEVPDYNTAFMTLESGAADAVAMDIGVAEYQLESRGEGFMILEQPLSTEQYAVGFLKGNTELRDQVQKTLEEMYADGTFTKISDEWGLTDSVCFGK